MTYIQPNQPKNFINLILAGLIFGLFLSVFSLIAIYNNVVNLEHNVATAKAAVDSIGAQNTALNNQVVAALGNIRSNALATSDGLVQDNHPQYFSQSWPIASQQ